MAKQKSNKDEAYVSRYFPKAKWEWNESHGFWCVGGLVPHRIIMTLAENAIECVDIKRYGWGVSTASTKFLETSRYHLSDVFSKTWLDMLIDRLQETIWNIVYESFVSSPEKLRFKEAELRLNKFNHRVKSMFL